MRAMATGLLPARLRADLVSDERLVARARAGDPRAFEAIYDRYERPIRSFCRHLLGQPDDADDAVQHTFLAAYRAIRTGDQALDLRPWLFTVARNRCRSLLRSRRRDPFVHGDAPEPSTDGLTAEVERRESLRDLLRDIGGLPEDQRAALILTQLETLKHDEVARVLQVPTDKVKALVFQARSSLISTQRARETACHEIREQLATLNGPALRRGNLKRHLSECTGCRDFQVALRRQRAAIAVLLPVAAHPALKSKVLAELAGGGTGAAGAGAGAGASAGGTLGSLVAKGAMLKVAVAVTVAVAGAEVSGAGAGVVRAVANTLPRGSDSNTASFSTALVASGAQPGTPRHGGAPGGASAGRPGSAVSITFHDPSSAPMHGANDAGHQPAAAGGSPASAPAVSAALPPGVGKKPGGGAGSSNKGGASSEHSNKPAEPPGRAKKPSSPPGRLRPHPQKPGLVKKNGGKAGVRVPAADKPPKPRSPANGNADAGGDGKFQGVVSDPAGGNAGAGGSGGGGNGGGNGNGAGSGGGDGNGDNGGGNGGNGGGTGNGGGGGKPVTGTTGP